jgi:hypothetical protein
MIGLVLLYVGHGLFHREPWRGEDLLGIALARSTIEALLNGQWQALLLPQLQGLAWNSMGPLWVSILGIFMLPAYLWAHLTQSALPLQLIDDLARVPVAIAMLLGFTAVWKSADRFARRREAQPIDPLGVGPRAQDFGKTLGDCALLLTLSCLGVIYPWHQAGMNAALFLLIGLMLWSLATAAEAPKRAAVQLAMIVLAMGLIQGVGLFLAAVVAVIVIFLVVPPYRLVAATFLPRWLALTFALLGVWLLLCILALPADRLQSWWSEQLADWAVLQFLNRPEHLLPGTRHWFRESLWKWWPLWPMVLFGLWQARRGPRGSRITLMRAPQWAVPLIVLGALMLFGFLGPVDWRIHHLLPIAPLALIAAFSLLSMPRALVNLIDWFAVALFTAVGIAIWLYWSAINFGFPAALARRIPILAPGVTGNANVYEVATGITATVAWIALVVWRLRRGNPKLWRPVVLSAGGLTLIWVLMMTLWLPAIDRIQGQTTTAQSLERAWINAASQRYGIQVKARLQPLPEEACITLSERNITLDSMAVAMTHLPIAQRPDCRWRLDVTRMGAQQPPETLLDDSPTPRWKIVWRSRDTDDRRSRERYLLLERIN